MDIDFELQKYNVSRETIQKLKDFVAILRDWNEKMNLVSKNSMEDVWERHVLDSLQLMEYLPAAVKSLVDIGSGAGFPGMVLAIAMQEKFPAAQITLVESITKKTVYLKDVCQKLGLNNVRVENNRVENIVFKKVDVILSQKENSLHEKIIAEKICAPHRKLETLARQCNVDKSIVSRHLKKFVADVRQYLK